MCKLSVEFAGATPNQLVLWKSENPEKVVPKLGAKEEKELSRKI